MKHTLILAMLCLAAPAFAGAKKDCAQQAEIVARAAALRVADVKQADALAQLQEGEDAIKGKYAAAVPAIVDWIYTVDQKDLVANDAAAAYEAACLAN